MAESADEARGPQFISPLPPPPPPIAPARCACHHRRDSFRGQNGLRREPAFAGSNFLVHIDVALYVKRRLPQSLQDYDYEDEEAAEEDDLFEDEVSKDSEDSGSLYSQFCSATRSVVV